MQYLKKKQPIKASRKEKRKRSLDQQYIRMNSAIEISLKEDYLGEQLAKYGYPREKILEGRERLDRLEQLSQEQRNKWVIYVDAARVFREVRKEAGEVYARFIKIARIAFQDDRVTSIEFRLKERRKRDYAGWRAEALVLYNNLLGSPEALAEMGKYSVTPEQLEAGKQLVTESEKADYKKLSAYSQSQHQQATEAKDKSFMIMKRWFSAFMEKGEKGDRCCVEKGDRLLWVKKNRKKKHINSPTVPILNLPIYVTVALKRSRILSSTQGC